MRRRFNPFIAIVLAILVSGYAYLGISLIAPIEPSLATASGPVATHGLSTLVKLALWGTLLLPFGLIAWLPLVYWRLDEPTPRQDRILRAAFASMALLSFLLLFVVLRDVTVMGARVFGLISGLFNGGGIVGGATSAVTGWASGPNFLPLWLFQGQGSLLILGLALASMAAGYREATRLPAVTQVEVPISGLPEALRGLRIAQISDLHIGPTIRRPFVEKIVGIVNSLDPDLIALTGDIVDGDVGKLGPDFAALGGLKASLGRFYVTGNHEYYWDALGWIRAVAEAGITPLTNTHAVVERDGAKVVVAGVLDFWATRNGSREASDPSAALHGAPSDASLRILLAHQPKSALAATTLGYDLQLSGHTHGGQFVPWTLVVRGFQPFVRGLHRVGRMWLYVNRGTGYWGPPVRLGASSEITLLRLVREH